MNTVSILLYVVVNHSHTSILFLGVVSVFLAALFVLVFIQFLHRKNINDELRHLASMRRYGIEHEMVLKAMKLASWRLDVKSRKVTFECDYRAEPDVFAPGPGTTANDTLSMIDAADSKRVSEALEDICAGRTDEYHQQYLVRMPHSDRMFWAEAYATVAERDEKGLPITIVGTTACINDAKKLERELIEARNKAEENDRLKSKFIANISHEVRTPLNSIVGFSEILPTITDENERGELIKIIKDNNEKLLRIFDDMMAISKMDAARDNETLNVSDFDIVESIRGIEDKYKKVNKNPAVDISFVSPLRSLIIHTDRKRLILVMEHFVENAMKFTQAGSITIGLSSDGGWLRLYVADTGKGIPEKEKEHVFDRFVKLDYFVQGAGLGLSVCRSYVYSLGGNIGVDSQEGVGSTFWIVIPERI